MGFTIDEITQGEIDAKGVTTLPDTPTISAAALKAKFEETSTDLIIPKLNEVISELDNNGMTRAEISQEIEDRIAYVGGGDMAKAVYDTDDDGTVDSADLADNANRLDGHARSYFAVRSTTVSTSDLKNLYYKGETPISTPANDTVANWKDLGCGIWRYKAAGKLNHQPQTHGLLMNIVDARNVNLYQLWFTVASNSNIYVRAGNSTGWNGKADDDGNWWRYYRMMSVESLPESPNNNILYLVTE